MKTHHDLDVWKKAIDFVTLIYKEPLISRKMKPMVLSVRFVVQPFLFLPILLKVQPEKR